MIRMYCYKCRSLLQYCRRMVNPSIPNEYVTEDVYECPICKHEIVVWEKK